MEAIEILARLMRKIRLYDTPLGKVPAVPLEELSKELEKLASTQTVPETDISGVELEEEDNA